MQEILLKIRYSKRGLSKSLKKHLDFLAGFELILLYIVLGLIKFIIQAEMPLEKY